MKKKTIFLLLILTGILPIACCPENPSGPYVMELRQVLLIREVFLTEPRLQYSDIVLAPNDTYTEDTLVLKLGFHFMIAQNPINFTFQPSAFALSCDDFPNYQQLKDKIKNISITSDKQFNEIEPGEALNDKVVSYCVDLQYLLKRLFLL